jgi:guanine deaminase
MCDHPEQHAKFMAEAAKISRDKMNAGFGGPFGAVVVKDGEVIGTGFNKVTTDNDPTAHAEVVAIRDACANIGDFNLSGAVIYTSCEPCPMCLSSIYWARLDKVYYANTRWDAAKIGFDDAEIYDEVAKDIEDRKIPMVHLTDDVATLAFDEWGKKEDKVQY